MEIDKAILRRLDKEAESKGLPSDKLLEEILIKHLYGDSDAEKKND